MEKQRKGTQEKEKFSVCSRGKENYRKQQESVGVHRGEK